MRKRLRICVKEWLAALVIFSCNAFLWWYFRSYLCFCIGVLMLLAIGLSAWILWRSKEKVRVEALLPEEAIGKNTPVPLAVRVKNESSFLFPVCIRYRLCNDFTAGSKECTYIGAALPRVAKKAGGVGETFTMLHYGNLTLQIGEVRLYDLLHLFYWEHCGRRDAWVVAAPANSVRSELTERRIALLMPEETLRRSPDYSADYEIREYRQQDSMRDIHWKLTAKQQKLMVRERLSEGKPTVNVVLKLTENPEENDGCMEVLDGLCRRLLAEKYPIRLYWSREAYQLKQADISSAEELDVAIYEILSGSGVAPGGDAEELFGEEHPGEEAITVGRDGDVLPGDSRS